MNGSSSKPSRGDSVRSGAGGSLIEETGSGGWGGSLLVSNEYSPFSRDGEGPRAPGTPARRVVNIGRTGLERMLRRDRGIDLRRASSPVEAIAELAEPGDDDRRVQTVVVYHAETIPSDFERFRFALAARSIDDTVVLIAIDEGGRAGWAEGPDEERDDGPDTGPDTGPDLGPDLGPDRGSDEGSGDRLGDGTPTVRRVAGVRSGGRSPGLDALLGESATANDLFRVRPDPETVRPPNGAGRTEPSGAADRAMRDVTPSGVGSEAATGSLLLDHGQDRGSLDGRGRDRAGGGESVSGVSSRAGSGFGPEDGSSSGSSSRSSTGMTLHQPAFDPLSLHDGPRVSEPSALSPALSPALASAFLRGDGAVVEAALMGRDAVKAAVALLASRLGAPGLRYEDGTTSAGLNEMGEAGIPVVREGRTLGTLWCPPELSEAVATDAASWLAGWVALATQHASLRKAAFTDPLTGAFNRRYFDKFLAGAIRQARKSRLTITLLLFDIDGFKSFNDRYGHAAGDEILIETVRLLTSVVRPGDRVCRVGGDEFVVVFFEPSGPRDPGSKPPESVQHIAARFQAQVRARRFPKLGLDAPGALGISGGLATFPWDGHDAESLLKRADELAMRAKEQGKNCITFGPGAVMLGG